MLVRRTGEKWHEPEVGAYPNEAELQEMIAESPSLLPGVDGPVAVASEFPCAFGRIDIVGVDLTGQITLCECKAAQNPELRRKVIGQLFAYAAAVWELSWEEFAERFERAAGTPLVATAQRLAAEAGEDDWDEETFRQEVARCLEAGEFRLVLAVEVIPDELRETVRFLNVHSTPGLEVLALELSYRRDGEVEILVPRTWGEEVKPPSGRSRGRLTRETVVALIGERHSEVAADAAARVLDWAEEEPRLKVRYTPTSAIIGIDSRRPVVKLWPKRSTNRGLEVTFRTLENHGAPWDDEHIQRLRERLADIGVNLEGHSGWPKAPLAPLADDTRRARFIKLMDEPLDSVAGSR